jgi:hypothetical protein
MYPSIYDLFQEKTIPEISVELLIININYNKKIINNMKTLFLKIMKPKSRIIFINSDYAFSDLLSLSKKCNFALEIKLDNLVSFVKF